MFRLIDVLRHAVFLVLCSTALVVLLIVSANAQVFGPAGTDAPASDTPLLSGSIEDLAPLEMCLPDGCTSVRYAWDGDLVFALASLPSGYQVAGWSGPCPVANRAQCPDVYRQAFADLKGNALRANRAIRLGR